VNVTDRAKRYRAQKNVTGPRKCCMCGSLENLGVMHLDGNEDHGEPKNLAWGCKSCNGILAAAFKKAGIGKPTNQYNPASGTVPTYQQYAWAVSNHSRGAHDEGGAIIHATPKKKRIEYARQIAAKAGRTKRERHADRWNPAGESRSAFKEFHGYDAKELVTVEKKVHHHQHLAAAGQLVGLQVRPIAGAIRTIEGLGKNCFLAFNEKKNQLFIEGGNQALAWAELKRFGIKTQHELQTLGKLVGVGYFTNKTHLGDEGGEAIYSHTFRTTNENGRHVTVKIAKYPDLIYRVLDEHLEVSGGDYIIRREGIDK
jgi:hypothetical protein